MAATAELLIFTRYPLSGQAKTRLIPALGPEGAARLQRRLTEAVVETARQTCATGEKNDIDLTICCTGGRQKDFRAWLGPDLRYKSQDSGHLGARLQKAFAQAFSGGAARVLTIGADIPGLTPVILRRAFQSLNDSDVVIGPAADGGYYLIGMKRACPALFARIAWGTEKVFAQTLEAATSLEMTIAVLPTLNDIDEPGDLAHLSDDPRFADLFGGKSLLSVIVPTLNEEAFLEATLQRIRNAEGIEIIVADGGSRDATRAIAERAGAAVLNVVGGRAAQMNAAAAKAKGRILLFLHADTRLPQGFAEMIRTALDDPAIVAGAFRFWTDGAGMALRFVERAVNFRSSRCQWPYGDQGLFMEKRVFTEEGGFAPLPIMEDFALVRRLRRRGRIVTLRHAALTSARRWKQLGILRTTVINQLMILGYLLGLPPEALKRFYRGRMDKTAHSRHEDSPHR